MSTKPDLTKYSSPDIVARNTRRLFGKNARVRPSTRKTKKYMLYRPDTHQWVHFGQMNYEDYTKHHDRARRARFQTRNSRWKTADKYSPAYLAYHLLW